MKQTTYNELAAKGNATTERSDLTIKDLREFVNGYIMHGHVILRPDGLQARCGGPPLCKGCAMEQAIINAMRDFFQ